MGTVIGQLRRQLKVTELEAPSLEILFSLAAHKFNVDVNEFADEYGYNDEDFISSDEL